MTVSARARRQATARDRALLTRLHGPAYWGLHLAARIGGAVKVPGVGLIVSEATLVRDVLLDTQNFAKVGPGSSGDLWTPIIGPNGILNMDGEAHATIRTQLAPLFTPKYIIRLVDALLEPQMENLLTRVSEGLAVDIVSEVETTAATLVCQLAGYDLQEMGTHELLSELDKLRSLFGQVTLTTKRFSAEQIEQGKSQLSGIVANIRRSFRASGSNSVAGTLREQGLNEDDTVSAIVALIITGTETVVSFIPRFVALLLDSGYLHRLAENDAAVADVINEGLRVIVPSPVMLRAVRRPTVVARRRVKPGDRVVLATYESCARGGDFNPERPIPAAMRQLWFGAGPRFCIGMPLAMAQIKRYVDALIRAHRACPLDIIGATPRTTGLIPGYESLVIQQRTP